VSGLIERIEAAVEGSRELDASIYQILNPHMLPTPGKIGSFYDPTKAGPIAAAKYHMSGGATGVAKFYTTSMDAVLTLIDPADEWQLSTIYNIARAEVGVNRDHQTSWPGSGEHEGNNPVLALLAAALRARETTPSIKGGDRG